ncbi:hypothetical protein CN692_24885 [Bacillus sp. AFS002410]|uniref:hypothetical protein n=1 Tax=Bacillus sp. AFS002410 TaxID=2033481 RepID=UPI000BEFD735|nr:hypothetical protein [Bacillus sp. AFS002410]PEJ47599.1 hypothetical protein CN692_24885 [Bacillus sp. AFS002410]
MKRKIFWIPIIVFIVTTTVFYVCGNLFNIESLKWFNFEETTNGGFTIGGSLNPINFGFAFGFIVEWSIKAGIKSAQLTKTLAMKKLELYKKSSSFF